MMNPTLENLQLDLESLRAQARFLNDEMKWTDQQIRAQETLLAHVLHPKFPRRQWLGAGVPTPPADDTWHEREVMPVERALADLQHRKSLLGERSETLQGDMTALVTLLDRCRRHVGALPDSSRQLVLAGQTGGHHLGADVPIGR